MFKTNMDIDLAELLNSLKLFRPIKHATEVMKSN
jgi:hypothetical protein